MSGCNPSVSVVFNGEIYNFPELQQELGAKGHRFHTHSDTETIPHAYEEYSADLVPPEILNRPKQGFAVPLDSWLRGQLREQAHTILTEPRTRQSGYFQEGYVELLLAEHQRGRRDHSARLWNLLMPELWRRQFVDKPARRWDNAPAALVAPVSVA